MLEIYEVITVKSNVDESEFDPAVDYLRGIMLSGNIAFYVETNTVHIGYVEKDSENDYYHPKVWFGFIQFDEVCDWESFVNVCSTMTIFEICAKYVANEETRPFWNLFS